MDDKLNLRLFSSSMLALSMCKVLVDNVIPKEKRDEFDNMVRKCVIETSKEAFIAIGIDPDHEILKDLEASLQDISKDL